MGVSDSCSTFDQPGLESGDPLRFCRPGDVVRIALSRDISQRLSVFFHCCGKSVVFKSKVICLCQPTIPIITDTFPLFYVLICG